MFCKNCGKEINEGTKFCNHCGASQEASAPQPIAANNTATTPAPKNNSTLKIVIIAAVAVVCFAIGSFVIAPSFKKDTSNDNDQPVSVTETDATEQSNTDNTPDDNASVEQSQTLEEIVYNADKISGLTWKKDLGADVGSMTVSAGYCTENDFIYNISFSVKIKKGFEQYNSFKSELEYFKKQIEALNDKEMDVDFDKTDDGIEFFAWFDGLEYTDRTQRVNMAADLIGITANAQNVAFYKTSVDTELKSYDFK